MELSAILRSAALHHGGAASSGDSANDGDATDGDDCGSPDLDESLDSHFNYIQKVSAPQVGLVQHDSSLNEFVCNSHQKMKSQLSMTVGNT